MSSAPTKNESTKFVFPALIALGVGGAIAWIQIAQDLPILLSVGSAVFLGLAAAFLARSFVSSPHTRYKWMIPAIVGVVIGVIAALVLGYLGGNL